MSFGTSFGVYRKRSSIEPLITSPGIDGQERNQNGDLFDVGLIFGVVAIAFVLAENISHNTML